MEHWKRPLAAVCLAALLSGCGAQPAEPLPAAEDGTVQRQLETLADASASLAVWSVYWDGAADARVLRETAGCADAVSLFAASFEDGAVVLPEATGRILQKLRRSDKTASLPVYLSVVNDVVQGGETVQKDTAILRTLLGTEDSARAHAAELVQLAAENGFDGVEIDYEKIRDDLGLWADFLRFEGYLLDAAAQAGLGVRVVLEPGTPAGLDFPAGAEYVVMCYNLYGYGTEPGPKADLAFLRQMCEKFADVPNLSFALANGGFDWTDGAQSPASLSAEDAAALAAQYGGGTRDADSAALHFTYQDGGRTHTVWYADEQTLAAWAACIGEAAGGKPSVSLWRM